MSRGKHGLKMDRMHSPCVKTHEVANLLGIVRHLVLLILNSFFPLFVLLFHKSNLTIIYYRLLSAFPPISLPLFPGSSSLFNIDAHPCLLSSAGAFHFYFVTHGNTQILSLLAGTIPSH